MAIVLGLFLSSAPLGAAQPAPDWTLTSSEGDATRLSAEVRQQPVVLFFWATWCPYCKALLPHLQSIRLEHGVEVAAIYGVYGAPGVILVDQEQQIRFDLRTLPQLKPPGDGSKTSHQKKAAYLAPYWAAELRKSIDLVLRESTQ